MHHVRVNCCIHAPAEKVFDYVTDNDRFFDADFVRALEMLREGRPGRHGLGVLRRINAGLCFDEEITVFDRPRRRAPARGILRAARPRPNRPWRHSPLPRFPGISPFP